MNAVDPREYLMSLTPPLAKPGRGRFSGAAKEALAKARAEGVVFLDKAKGGVVASVPVMTESGQVVTEKRMVNEYAQHAPALRTGMLTFVKADGNTMKVNSTEGCVSCLYSFGWCKCEVPSFRYWLTGEVMTLADDER